mgnify:CR=1 FL=1
MRDLGAISLLGLTLLACGGSPPPAPEAPSDAPAEAVPAPAKTMAPQAEETPKEEPVPAKAALAEPQFQEGMSVEEAIKAVPQGAERANMDSETLGKPLQDFGVYEPCKPGTARFKLRIAVWDGKVVGTDVTTTPKNEKLTACIKDRLKTLTWQAKVRSLNVVEYAF